MALQKTEAELPILGLDTHADPKNATPGTLDLIENMWFKRGGGGKAELRKRYGVTSLTRNILGGGTLSAGKKLATFDDQRLMNDGAKLYSYSPQVTTWQSKGNHIPLGIRAEKVAGSIRTRKTPDAAISGNLMCVVNVDDNPHLLVSVIDLNTGNRLINDVDTTMGSAAGCFVLALSSAFVIVSQVAGATTIQAVTISYATPSTVSGTTNLVTDANASGRMDVIRRGTNDDFLLAYHSTTAGKQTRVRQVLSNLTLGGDVGNADQSDQCIGWLQWDNSDGSSYLAYAGSAVGAKMLTITGAAAAIGATTTIDATVTSARNCTGYHASGPTNRALFEVAGASTYLNKVRLWTGSGATSVWQLGCGLGSKAWTQGGKYFVTLAYEDSVQNCYLPTEMSGSTPNIVGRSLYGLGGGVSKTASVLPAVPAISSTVFALPVLRFSYTGPGGSIYDAYFLRVDHSPALSPYKRLGDNLHLHGGVMRSFDGTVAVEQGHHVAPVIFGVSASNGGSLTTLKTYQITACYMWVDYRGQIHRSAPAAVVSTTLTGTQAQIAFSVTYSRIGDKPATVAGTTSNMWVEIYATAGDGQTFYKFSTLFNDTATDSIAGSLNITDATITAGAVLYTDGGVLPHIPPPPCTLVEQFRNRLVLGGCENPFEIWVSNESEPGQGASFSDALAFQLPADGGYFQAMAELDGRLIIFRETAIDVLSGAGPTKRGAGQFDQPDRLTGAIGASSQWAARTPQGLVFKSAKGFYLLPVGGGMPVRLFAVEAYDSLTVGGMLTVKDQEQARVYTTTGRTLAYHWGFKNQEGLGAFTTFTGQSAVDAIVWNNGTAAYLDSNGTVKEEIPGQWSDDGAAINEKARWTWLQLGGFLGRFRLYLAQILGEIMGSFTLSTSLGYTDFDTTTVDVETLAVTTATKMPLPLVPVHEKAIGYQVTIEETSTTEGFRLSGLGLQYGAKQGAGKVPVGQVLS